MKHFNPTIETDFLNEERLHKITREDLAKKCKDHDTYAESYGASGKNLELIGYDLADHDLSGFDLSGAVFFACSFRRTNLRGTQLRHANIRQCSFISSVLTNVEAVSATIHECAFYKCCIDSSSFIRARITKCELRAVTGYNVRFDAACLSDNSLIYCKLTATHLLRADLRRSMFDNTTLADVKASYSVWTDAKVYNCKFAGVDFSHAVLINTIMVHMKFSACYFKTAAIIIDGWSFFTTFDKVHMLYKSHGISYISVNGHDTGPLAEFITRMLFPVPLSEAHERYQRLLSSLKLALD